LVRNDFPDHPAGPLDHEPDPDEVLVVRPSPIDYYLVVGTSFLTFFFGVAMFFSKPVLQNVGIAMAVLGAVLYGISELMSARRGPVLIIRPDGVEFPRDKFPPLHWHDIAGVTMGTMNVIGGGGAHDYLGIVVKPELNYPKRGDLGGRLTQMLTQWNFHVCFGMGELDRPVAHLVMEMRARKEAADAAPPAPPPGMEPLRAGVVHQG